MTKKTKTKKKPKVPLTKAQKRLRTQRIIAGILIFCLTIGITGATGVVIFGMSANKNAPEMKEEDFFRKESSKLVDKDGNVFYETGRKLVENITYDDLPQNLIDSLVAIEDSRFFQHDGVDIPRFTKAMMTNVADTLKRGRLMFSQGGSTLTMQLIKNTYFTYENADTNEIVEAASSGVEGVSRKFQELYLARKLEKEQIISKQETIALYLNTANFGAQNNIIGIQNSAERYFGKDVKDLSLVESAFLAGVLNAPNAYSPYNSIKNAKSRTADVLYYLNYHGYITDEEYELASEIDLENLLVPVDISNEEANPNQAYIDVVLGEVRELVKDSNGNPVDAVEGGMTIYTAMAPTVQAGIDKVQRREIASMDHGASTNIQVGSTVVNNKTGEIVGVVGGYDYKGELIFNNARDAYTQPASVVKPVLDYALAFEYLGWSTNHLMLDAPYKWAGTSIEVGNYDGRFLGEITLMHAVADSRNIPAIQALTQVIETIGNDGVIKYMNNVGFSKVNSDNFAPAFAIGGNGFDTTTMELAGAYATMMNGGNYIKPHTITKIEFENGREPIVNAPSAVSAISDAAAYLAADTMRYAVEGPYPGYLRSVKKPYTVYGKTGTNRYTRNNAVGAPSNGQRDRLMIAATSEFTTATWVGFVKFDKELKPWITPGEAEFNMTGKMSSYLLDLVEEAYGRPSPLTRPDSVANIEHILGPFPYQVPLEGMNPDLISKNALIKKDFLKLVEATPQELENLASANVTAVDKNGSLEISVEMTPYPDESKLTIADPMMEVPGSSITVNRVYDDSYVFGAVRYKSEIRANGEVVQEQMTESANQVFNYKYKYTDKIEVCSYYTFDLAESKKSNTLCSEVKVTEPTVNIPTFTNQNVQVFRDFETKNGLTNVVYETIKTTDENKNNLISTITPNIENSNKTISEIQAMKQIKVTYYVYEEKEVEIPDEPSDTTYNFSRNFISYFTRKYEIIH